MRSTTSTRTRPSSLRRCYLDEESVSDGSLDDQVLLQIVSARTDELAKSAMKGSDLHTRAEPTKPVAADRRQSSGIVRIQLDDIAPEDRVLMEIAARRSHDHDLAGDYDRSKAGPRTVDGALGAASVTTAAARESAISQQSYDNRGRPVKGSVIIIAATVQLPGACVLIVTCGTIY
jgi:hypothetical protein